MTRLRPRMHDNLSTALHWRVTQDSEECLELEVSQVLWCTEDGLTYLEEDLKVNGERWRIHRNDPDPHPSKPHAHCVGGKNAGCKLHLGTGQLYVGTKPLNRYMDSVQFEQLLDYARGLFPAVQFPL
jgi:hypothetical protein